MVSQANDSPKARRKTLKIFVEGGGDPKNQPKRKDLRGEAERAFNRLIQRGTGMHVSVVACGGRARAFDRFSAAVSQGVTTPVLLVDAEAAVADIEKPWAHLKARDGWMMPVETDDAHAFLMVQAMETWLLADPVALASAVGRGFKASKITKWRSLEAVSKEQMKLVMAAATVECDVAYDKGTHSFAALAEVDAAKLRAACPSAARLFDTLKEL